MSNRVQVAEVLEGTTTDELVEALLARVEHGVFMGLVADVPGEDRGIRYWRRWKGNTHTCMGLCADASMTIREGLEDLPDDDEESEGCQE